MESFQQIYIATPFFPFEIQMYYLTSVNASKAEGCHEIGKMIWDEMNTEAIGGMRFSGTRARRMFRDISQICN